jgi:hypothetical protein
VASFSGGWFDVVLVGAAIPPSRTETALGPEVASDGAWPTWARQGEMLVATRQANEAHFNRIKSPDQTDSLNLLPFS